MTVATSVGGKLAGVTIDILLAVAGAVSSTVEGSLAGVLVAGLAGNEVFLVVVSTV